MLTPTVNDMRNMKKMAAHSTATTPCQYVSRHCVRAVVLRTTL